MAPTGSSKPSKLCRRTYFLQSGTGPAISEMRNELGPELADIIVATLQPSQRSGVKPDCTLVSHDPGGEEHDSEKVREQIHDHILQLGGKISQRVDGYWRHRLKQVATAGVSTEEMDFLRFECRQKIDIARDEERKRYNELLDHMAESLKLQFWEEKGELHRSYAKARALWGEFVCRKVRKQAKDMLIKIAAQHRVQLEREVTRRMQIEEDRIMKEMEQIVRTAVDQQKRTDERAMQWMVYQYEELLKFINDYNECVQAVEVTRELCKLQDQHECRSTQVSEHSLVIQDRVESLSTDETIGSMDDLDDDVRMPSSSLSKYNVFVVSQCLPEPISGGSAIGSEAGELIVSQPEEPTIVLTDFDTETPSSEEDSESSSIEKIVIGGLTYAQPKYYKKIYNELFGDVVMSWQRYDSPEPGEESKKDVQDPLSISSERSRSLESSNASEEILSEPSYRESYDAIAVLRNMLSSKECVASADESDQEGLCELFDLSKSKEEISSIADEFASQYIRATDNDFDDMFPKTSDGQ